MNWHPTMTMDDQSDPHETLRRQAKDRVVHVATGEATQADLQALERWRSKVRYMPKPMCKRADCGECSGHRSKRSRVLGIHVP